jgi:hypothetical protein
VAEPEHATEPDGNATAERNAETETRIEAEPGHPKGEAASSVAEENRRRNSVTHTRNADGSTTTTSVRDGYTTTRTFHSDGSFTKTNNDPREAHSTLVGPRPSSSLYSGTAPTARPMPQAEQDPEQAEATLRQMNETRAQLSGINKLPIPQGHVLSTTSGVAVRTNDGRMYSLRADGTLAHFQSGVPAIAPGPTPSRSSSAAITAFPGMGTRATFRRDGKIVSLHTGGPNGIHIQHGARGWRVITVHRPDHTTLVSTGRRSGYLERTIDRDGHTLVQRTYLSGSRAWTRTYQGSYPALPPNVAVARTATGAASNRIVARQYIPRYTYQPVFYIWVYGGWPGPVFYQWNWGARRWFIYYSLYFYPWPSYSDGSYWLTDYVLGQTLANGFDTGQPGAGSTADASSALNVDTAPVDAGQPSDDESLYAPATTAITPEVKQEIAAEVHQQLAQASGADTTTDSAPAPTLAPNDPFWFMQEGHIFVVSTPIAATVRGQELPGASQQCTLSPGDILRLTRIVGGPGNSPTLSAPVAFGPAFATGELEVESSQRGDCPAGVQLTLPSLALQEMENDFQAQLDDGLHVLYSQQGKDSLPAAPATTVAEQPAPADAAPTASELAAELQGLQAQANQAEAHLTQTVMTAQAAANQP